jgi:nicotinate-nucleotide--dimethylbenzimidazole phosphoribosyltransferase
MMNNASALSFLDAAFRKMYPQDYECRQLAEQRLGQLALPQWAVGDLIDLAVDLAGMTRSLQPPVGRKKVVVMVGDHGVAAEGVSNHPEEAAAETVRRFAGGGAGLNGLAGGAGAGICVVDVGIREDVTDLAQASKILVKKIGRGTTNMVYGPAMTRTHAVMAVEAGIEVADALAAEVDVFALGELEGGADVSSAAIAAVFIGKKVAELVGHDVDSGGGLDEERRRNRIAVIEKALARNKPDAKDGLDVLAKVGGFEIGAMAGLIIGAAGQRKPVIIDGFASAAGAMIACSLEPFARDYLVCARQSLELGHGALLAKLQRKPLLACTLRLGVGAGAALGMHVVDAAAALLADAAACAKVDVRDGL